MSFSVDDLVSSLSSSHIGQEASDLAALQAQLSATLFCGPSSSTNFRGRSNTQTCSTPLARTPSSSFSMGMAMDTVTSRRGSQSYTRRAEQPSYYHNANSNPTFDDMEEDERMVEELLIPSSPVVPSTPTFGSSHFNSFSSSHSSYPIPSSPVSSSVYPSYVQQQQQQQQYFEHQHQHHQQAPSLFTTTDPFYLSQLQAAQQPFASNTSQQQSVFAQNGRMTQGSPFSLFGQAQTAF